MAVNAASSRVRAVARPNAAGTVVFALDAGTPSFTRRAGKQPVYKGSVASTSAQQVGCSCAGQLFVKPS